ncbi:MAG: hypothetical protein ACOX2X_08460 [Peptococcia bacterium]
MMRPEQRKQAQANLLEMSGSIVVIVAIIIAVLFLKISGSSGRLLDTKYIMTDEVKITDNMLEVKGACTKTVLVYKSHRYEIEGNALYLEIRFSKAEELDIDNHFEIVIEDEALARVSEVFLQGKKEEDQKMIWES